jgi:ATP-dependent DNA ligase
MSGPISAKRIRGFPEIIKPMLCTLVKEPFTKPRWIYEVKWDGYRIIAYNTVKMLYFVQGPG